MYPPPLPSPLHKQEEERWFAYWNDQYDRHYYFNPATGETTWTMPDNYIEESEEEDEYDNQGEGHDNDRGGFPPPEHDFVAVSNVLASGGTNISTASNNGSLGGSAGSVGGGDNISSNNNNNNNNRNRSSNQIT